MLIKIKEIELCNLIKLPVVKLFYNLVEDLINKSKITTTEVEKLKTKEYTKTLFKATDYPAIANNVTDNMGNSSQKRYRAKELRFNGKDVLTVQYHYI